MRPRILTSLAVVAALLATPSVALGVDAYPTSGTTSSSPTTPGSSTTPYVTPGAPTAPKFTAAGYTRTFTKASEPMAITFTISGTCAKPAVVAGSRTTRFTGSYGAVERWEPGGGTWRVTRLEGTLNETATATDTVAKSTVTDTDGYTISPAGLARTSRSHKKDSPTEVHDWRERWANGAAGSREGFELTITRTDTTDADGTKNFDERRVRLTWTGPLYWTRESDVWNTATIGRDGSGSTMDQTEMTERSLFPGTTVEASSHTTVSRTSEEHSAAGPLKTVRVSSDYRGSRTSPDALEQSLLATSTRKREYDFAAVLVSDSASYEEQRIPGKISKNVRTTTFARGEPASFTDVSGAWTFFLHWRDGRLVEWRDDASATFGPVAPGARPSSTERATLLKAYNALYTTDPAWRTGGPSAEAYPYRPYIEAPQGGG